MNPSDPTDRGGKARCGGRTRRVTGEPADVILGVTFSESGRALVLAFGEPSLALLYLRRTEAFYAKHGGK